MNSRYRSLVVAALAASLTVFAQAQSSGSSSTGSGSSSGSTGSSTGSSTRSTGSSMGAGSTSSSATRDASTGQSGTMRSSTSHSSMGSSSDMSSVQRVTKDSLKSQVTAKSLIGKNVHDSAGEKIGEVQDIVLDSTSAPQLASGFASRQDQSRSGSGSSSSSTSSSTQNAANPRVSPSGTYAAGAGGDGASTTSASDRLRSAGRDAANAARDLGASAMSAMSSSGPAAIISAGGMMGFGDSMIRVPLSQLSYDANEDRVTLNISRDQLSSVTGEEDRETSTRAAE